MPNPTPPMCRKCQRRAAVDNTVYCDPCERKELARLVRGFVRGVRGVADPRNIKRATR